MKDKFNLRGFLGEGQIKEYMNQFDSMEDVNDYLQSDGFDPVVLRDDRENKKFLSIINRVTDKNDTPEEVNNHVIELENDMEGGYEDIDEGKFEGDDNNEEAEEIYSRRVHSEWNEIGDGLRKSIIDAIQVGLLRGWGKGYKEGHMGVAKSNKDELEEENVFTKKNPIQTYKEPTESEGAYKKGYDKGWGDGYKEGHMNVVKSNKGAL